ncbi:MAG: helix-turn-helix transcriptional regulator [bacterium]|nr:helix-turn-helix transcriptional regulator [bacterium]
MAKRHEYDEKEVGNRLRQVRKTLKMTQGQMSGILNLTTSEYARIENGKAEITLEIVGILYSQFGVSFYWLLYGLDNMIILGHDRYKKNRPDKTQDLQRILFFNLGLRPGFDDAVMEYFRDFFAKNRKKILRRAECRKDKKPLKK